MKKSMKKLAALLLALAVMIPLCAVGAFADTAEATPKYTANVNWKPNDEGVFEISTPEDLLAMATKRTANGNYADKKVVLTADIDFNPGWDASTKTEPANIWTAMWNFAGTLDGQGHTIKGIYVSGTTNVGFIAGITGTVKDLKIENTYIKGTHTVGFVAFSNAATSKLENLYIDAIIEADGTHTNKDGTKGGIAGGILGNNNKGTTLTNCVFAGTVSGTTAVGGVVGNASVDCTITDCANYGTVVCPNAEVAAGVIGLNSAKITLTRCYNGGSVATGLINVAHAEGKAQAVVVEDCYYLGGTDLKGLTKTATSTNVTVKYDSEAVADAKTATAAELVTKTAFQAFGDYKGWSVTKDGKKAMPAMVTELVDGHDYTTVVTAPTCSDRGYTTFTCKNCGNTYNGEFVDAVAHVPGEEWIVDKEATVDFAGSCHKECVNCGKTLETKILDQLKAEETTAVEDTEEITTAAGDETTAEAPVTAEKGCGSSIALSGALGMAAMLALGAAVCKKRR